MLFFCKWLLFFLTDWQVVMNKNHNVLKANLDFWVKFFCKQMKLQSGSETEASKPKWLVSIRWTKCSWIGIRPWLRFVFVQKVPNFINIETVSQPAKFGRTLDVQSDTLIPAWWKIKSNPLLWLVGFVCEC